MDWVAQAEQLLYDGESIRETVPVGASGVVVTSHRLLAFTPDREGANFRQVDRPNVEGATYRTSGEFRFLQQAVKALVVGAVLVVAGTTVSLDGMVSGISLDSGGAAGAVGIGGMLGLLQSMLSLLAQLDDLLRLFGGLALAFGVVVLAVYVWSRERLLVIAVAGGDDIELTAPDDEGAVEQLRAAVVPGDEGAAPPSPPADDPLA
ncbi:hypothetical protein NDI56_11135 [Haloarcula sp. S1CR25-12]|uniref:Uncharacterized protein n=1 Tax=Haloarcula saliterrae TaxID=2950534 RepID=A0ABU2FCG2_9EURY|nr:hypothetical protein [Haloarcula sp. S1CR25-12]MDS0259948.1 hypothetical protein [Haloarcula sp. S1CR25-12]